MPPLFFAKPERWSLRPTRTFEPLILRALAREQNCCGPGEIGKSAFGSSRFLCFIESLSEYSLNTGKNHLRMMSFDMAQPSVIDYLKQLQQQGVSHVEIDDEARKIL